MSEDIAKNENKEFESVTKDSEEIKGELQSVDKESEDMKGEVEVQSFTIESGVESDNKEVEEIKESKKEE